MCNAGGLSGLPFSPYPKGYETHKTNHPNSLRTRLQLPLGSSMGGLETQSGTTQGLQSPKRGSPDQVPI